VTGVGSTSYPTTVGAYDRIHNRGNGDAFVTKLAPAGDQVDHSTFLGGADQAEAFGLALDGYGSAYRSSCRGC
jgi:hypothetical protein